MPCECISCRIRLRLKDNRYKLTDHRLLECTDPKHVKLMDTERNVVVSMGIYSIEITGTIEIGTREMIPVDEIYVALVSYIPTN